MKAIFETMRGICPKEAFKREFLTPYEDLKKVLLAKKYLEMPVVCRHKTSI
jgi:hypothetical protein